MPKPGKPLVKPDGHQTGDEGGWRQGSRDQTHLRTDAVSPHNLAYSLVTSALTSKSFRRSPDSGTGPEAPQCLRPTFLPSHI